MKRSHVMIVMYAMAHLFVDFACAFLMFGKIYLTDQWYLCLLLYNFCAFALQMPLGLLADRWNRNALCAACGCILLSLAYGFGNFPVMAAAVADTGNGLFHVGGGIDVLNVSDKKCSALGVFISPGAFGIYLGTMLGKKGTISMTLVVIVLLLTAGLFLTFQYVTRKSFISGNVPVSFESAGSQAAFIAIVCLFSVVFMRSYAGMTLNFPWKVQGYWGIILVSAVVLGKMAGGFLADRFGVVRTTVISLVITAVLSLLMVHPLAGVGSVLLFNMTMPVTLWATARLLRGSKGFSFGLLTFGLFLGLVPVYLGYEPMLAPGIGLTLAAVVSIPLLWFGLRRLV